MRSLNKVTLIGNLGADPEVKSTSGGNRVATFSLATTRVWNSPSGEKQEKTEWHRVVVWNSKTRSLADIVEKFLHKGDPVYLEGRVEYRQWQDKENQTRYMTEINANEILLLKGREDAEPVVAATPAKAASKGSGKVSKSDTGEFEDFKGPAEDEDEDLPF